MKKRLQKYDFIRNGIEKMFVSLHANFEKMKKISAFILLCACLVTLNAQTEPAKTDTTKGKKVSEIADRPLVVRDRLIFDIYHTFWMGTPSQGNFMKFDPGFNVSALWDFILPQNKSISFGLGVGFTYYTQYSNCVAQYVRKDDVTRYFILPEDLKYKYSRVSYMNVNIPIEMRYRHRCGFKIDFGVHVGLVAGFAQRYKGPSFLGDEEDFLNFKNRDFYNKQKFSADVFIRMGWKSFGVYYSYQLTKVFDSGKGPNMSPMSLGISIALF